MHPTPWTLADFSAAVRQRVDHRLATFFEEKGSEIASLSPRSAELREELEALTRRGGKRLRPIVAAAARYAASGEAFEGADLLGASLELLQTYLLAHDDIMDGDLTRRGGPSLHAAFRTRHGDDALGDALGILGGDLAQAYALELLLRVPFPEGAVSHALATFLELQKEVYLGQHLDLVADPDVERVNDLKTGSYTVRGPARLGAILAGASEAQHHALTRWANPLGQAFQLADDVLGTFGNSEATGKPGEDLRRGKRTTLVVLAKERLDAREWRAIESVLGRADATDHEVEQATLVLEASGVRASVVGRAADLLAASDRALDDAPLDPEGVELLRSIGRALVVRDR